VPRQHITAAKIAEHVQRLGELYPPIRLDAVDRTIKNPDLVKRRFGHVIDYLARVELEVDRNVLELLCLLPDVDAINKTFYADVWRPQEIQHGLILDRLQTDLGHAPAQPHLEVSFKIKILGALASLKPIQDIARLLYYLTGASTERQAVLAYMGGVLVDLAIDRDLSGYAREIGRVESRLLWAHKQGLEFPPYILKALRESVDLYRERLERGLMPDALTASRV
jgi:hypothetical protein